MTQIPDLPIDPPDDDDEELRAYRRSRWEHVVIQDDLVSDPLPYSSRRHSEADGPMHYVPRSEP